jgi:hypothetical protein
MFLEVLANLLNIIYRNVKFTIETQDETVRQVLSWTHEMWTDTEGAGQQKMKSRGAKDVNNGERQMERGKFVGLHPERQILSRQPYTLLETIAGSRGSVVVCLLTIPAAGLKKSRP